MGRLPLGSWAKNQRAAARLTSALAERRDQGLPVGSTAGALSEDRLNKLDEIDLD
ncbi:hypothetical protein [Streptomyces sp. NPDC058254]|uniref:hypothetical protein n=1 Tax=Streptomyces sp. NPDC058254 TaxID=3346406 RepID=UPI0036E7D652